MAAEDKPLSTLVSQGWEVVNYASTYDRARGMTSDSRLIRTDASRTERGMARHAVTSSEKIRRRDPLDDMSRPLAMP